LVADAFLWDLRGANTGKMIVPGGDPNDADVTVVTVGVTGE
jgi:hypothetical protein